MCRLRFSPVSLCAMTLALGAACPGQTFSDETAAAGLTCTHVWNFTVDTQMMAAGGAVGDFNRDGHQDLFVLGGWGNPDRLFINNGDGTFTESGAAWGVNRQHLGLAVAVGDFDRDGWLDLYVTSEASGVDSANSLYRNNGDGTFTDVAAAAGVDKPSLGLSGGWGAAFGDFDLDGHLDLAVADWLNPASGNRLFRNNGDGTFTDVTAAATGTALAARQGFSPRFCDMDGDGWPDLLWVSDFGRSAYLVNNGDGTFTESTEASGTGLDGNGMGTSIGDFNGDGRPDWFVSSLYSLNPQPNQPGTGNMLYINKGGHVYCESGVAAGVVDGGWGWGSVAVDFDHDGRVDIAHTNGWPDPEFAMDQTRVFRNTTVGGIVSFEQIAPGCGVTHSGQGRGMLNLDYDGDGAQDVVIFTNDGDLVLYRTQPPAGTHWLRLFFSTRGVPGLAPDGYGVHVTATTGGVAQHRWVCGGSNFLSQSELSAHFGLGASSVVDELRVRWPDGREHVWTSVAADRTITIPVCVADFNQDGVVNVSDIFAFLTAWFAGGGDTDLSGTSAVPDIFAFLARWFAGC